MTRILITPQKASEDPSHDKVGYHIQGPSQGSDPPLLHPSHASKRVGESCRFHNHHLKFCRRGDSPWRLPGYFSALAPFYVYLLVQLTTDGLERWDETRCRLPLCIPGPCIEDLDDFYTPSACMSCGGLKRTRGASIRAGCEGPCELMESMMGRR